MFRSIFCSIVIFFFFCYSWNENETLIRMAKMKMLTTLKTSEDVEQQNSQLLLGGMQNWYSYFERQVNSFYKDKHRLHKVQ